VPPAAGERFAFGDEKQGFARNKISPLARICVNIYIGYAEEKHQIPRGERKIFGFSEVKYNRLRRE